MAIIAMSISPSNKYLAVGGPVGVKIFYFNGSSSITKFTAAVPTGMGGGQFAWDKCNHLYVLSPFDLFVFTVTSGGIKQFQGPPSRFRGTSGMIVLSK